MVDLLRLKVLAELARHGSVTAVARELGYAQASISHHLSRLEAEVGLPLTQRAGRGIRLTPAGELLAQRAAEILGRQVSSAEDDLAAIGGSADASTSHGSSRRCSGHVTHRAIACRYDGRVCTRRLSEH